MKKIIIGIILASIPVFLPAESEVRINGKSISVSGDNVVIVDGKTVTGSGVTKKENRKVIDFHGMTLNISADVTITHADNTSLSISADDNILPIISTEVTGGILHISSKESFSSKTGIKVSITAPLIQELTLRGAGNISMDFVTKTRLHLTISGSGDISATGSVKTLIAQVHGSGDLHLQKLKSDICRITINGSGDAVVSPLETLDVRINGSGDVSYHGTPKKVSSRIYGSGRIHPKG